MIKDGLVKEFESKEEEIKAEIASSGLSLGYLIGSAKRTRGDDKKVITYTDKLSKEEQALFNDDYYLAGLVLKKKQIDKEIVGHMDKTVALHRARKPENPVDKIVKEAQELVKQKEAK